MKNLNVNSSALTLRCNDTSLVYGFGPKSGPDPNWVIEMWVTHFQDIRQNGTSLVLSFGR